MTGCVAFDHPTWGVGRGEYRNIEIPVSETYTGTPVAVPARVVRGEADGPTVCVMAAVHGDEINGTGIVRELIIGEHLALTRGTVILVPVVNILGFERQSRYMPDRRDPNRSFPGSPDGSLTTRFAHAIFERIIRKCDYGIDLHCAAIRRTNYPNVRADASNREVLRIARAFGAELIIAAQGPEGSLRRAATESGCATIILEAGEPWKVESGVMEYGVRGVVSVLSELGMVETEAYCPRFQTVVDKTTWLRASEGGFLGFHVSPGDFVEEGDPVCTQTTLLGHDPVMIEAPASGYVLGMTTLPTVVPGDPICHLALLDANERVVLDEQAGMELHEKVRDDLATSFDVQAYVED